MALSNEFLLVVLSAPQKYVPMIMWKDTLNKISSNIVLWDERYRIPCIKHIGRLKYKTMVRLLELAKSRILLSLVWSIYFCIFKNRPKWINPVSLPYIMSHNIIYVYSVCPKASRNIFCDKVSTRYKMSYLLYRWCTW